ncbi:GntR family transcriptional regulator [Arthrobacter sp. USHLN218]|uniref:GntR family transcriptional regulator n=1 Tax=Arthrobacter sp. USHLN218 TaxID=3081232 RepID=UPI00301B117E
MQTTAADPRPLAVQVYERICSDIVEGTLPAGTALVQEQIATQYGVSRTPVRDALTQVALEGLATLVPGRGYVVNHLTDQDIKNVYEVRELLESLAARQALGSHTRQQLVRLRALVDEFEALDPNNAEELFHLGLAFHAALIEPCPNDYLRKVLHDSWNHPLQRRISTTYFFGPEHQAKIVADHRKILEAVTDKDGGALEKALSCCNDPGRQLQGKAGAA